MDIKELNTATFSQLLDLFLSGQFESNDDEGNDYGYKARRELMSKAVLLKDIRPLFYSDLWSCLELASYMGEEGYFNREEFEELSDLMLMVSDSRFYEVRHSVCRFLYSNWDIKHAKVLIRYLCDKNLLVKGYAMAFFTMVSDEDFQLITKQVELDNDAFKETKHIFEYYTALRAGDNSNLANIVKLSGDDKLKYEHDNFSDLNKQRIKKMIELRETVS